ncbi:MAG: hypothetical protein M3Z36_02275 [Acidobacteriota bacterium]|nr:hypothetical protein [Acidobacteriota bacterium]
MSPVTGRGGAGARGHTRLRSIVPDLALIAATVSLFYALFLFEGYQKLFRDSDAGWHIRTGESILATGHLPRADPYSFTRAGAPWFAWEWGSDVLMGAVHRSLGLTGVAFLYGLAIAAGVWLWFRLNWIAGGNFLFACVLAAPMLSTASIHWLARPHVLSWLFLLGTVMFAEKFHGSLTWKHAATIFTLTALWTNLHASFFLGPLILATYAAGALLRRAIWDDTVVCSSKPLAVAALVAAAASLVNPYGWHLHQHVLRYLTDAALLDRIGEFQSFNFHAEGAFQIILALGIAMIGAVVALGQKNIARFLLSVGISALALRSARALPLVALLLLPLANGSIAQALSSARDLHQGLRRTLDDFLNYSKNLRVLDARGSGLAWAPLIAIAALGFLRIPVMAARTGFPPDQFPVAAASAIESLPESARILAPDKFGGYLIYRFEGRRKVFFDGRSDLYGAEFLKQYARLVQVRPGWREQLQAFQFTNALLPNDYSLVPALEQLGWTRVYRDSVATLLATPR